jgi:hypothetical protein
MSEPKTPATSPAAPCSTAPTWITAEEMFHYLRRKRYSHEIAAELAEDYATNLQRVFVRGFEMGQREQSNDQLSHGPASVEKMTNEEKK